MKRLATARHILPIAALLAAILALAPLTSGHSPPAESPRMNPAPQSAPVLVVDQDVAAFAIAPDNRIAFAVRRIIKLPGRVEIQRDDFWMLQTNGDKKRIVDGEKLVRSPVPYSYSVDAIRWSPDGTRLAADIQTSIAIDRDLNTRDAIAVLLLDQFGKEINIKGAQSILEDGFNGAWLPDGQTVAYLREAVKPMLLFNTLSARPADGMRAVWFQERAFSAVAWDTRLGAGLGALAVERNASLTGPVRLVWLDLEKQARRELGVLENFVGQLTLSPSGKLAAYFVDAQTLEIRDIVQPERTARLTLPLGAYCWTRDEQRLLVKRGVTSMRKSGSLDFFAVPPLAANAPASSAAGAKPKPVVAEPTPVLSGNTVRAFAISPDGKLLAITEPGGRNLKVYRLEEERRW